MRNTIKCLLLLPLLLGVQSGVVLADMEKIKSYGVYIAQDGDYVRVKSFKHWEVFYRHFKEIPVAEMGNRPLEVVIYQKDLDVNRLEFVAHPYEVLARNNRLSPIVTPIEGKKDMVKVTFEESVEAGSLLEIQLFWGSSFRGVVALSEPVAQLIRIYSNENQNATGVLDSLKDIIQAYPDKPEFKQLVEKWTVIEKAQKDDVDFQYVSESWDKYKKAEKLATKVHFLKKTQREINGYRSSHPKGKHIIEANEMEQEIRKKLDL